MTKPNSQQDEQPETTTVPIRTNDSGATNFTWQLTSGAIHIEVRNGVCYVNGSPVKPVNLENDQS